MFFRTMAGLAGCAAFLSAALVIVESVQFSLNPVAASRGDRIDIREAAARCSGASLIAACANSTVITPYRRSNEPAVLQVFERPNETILVRIPSEVL